jgi:endonuclease-3
MCGTDKTVPELYTICQHCATTQSGIGLDNFQTVLEPLSYYICDSTPALANRFKFAPDVWYDFAMSDTTRAIQEKYRAVRQSLTKLYGAPTWRQHLPPVDELVSTILSQSTTDLNRDKGFDALKARYPSWEAVRDAPQQDVIATIRPAGLANQKGPRIQAALRTVTEREGKLSLDHLAEMPINEAKVWLTSIDGVGPKTAAIILCFAFGLPAFPVDTHVHRVTGRLGLIPAKMTAEKAHGWLEGIVPEEDYYAFHLQVIQHGREVCDARRPKCETCPLRPECNTYQSSSYRTDSTLLRK